MSRPTVSIKKDELQAFTDFLDAKGLLHKDINQGHQVAMIRTEAPQWFSLYNSSRMPEHYRCDPRLKPLVDEYNRERHGTVMVDIEDLSKFVQEVLHNCHRLNEHETAVTGLDKGLIRRNQRILALAEQMQDTYEV